MWGFFHERSRITGLQGKWNGISLNPHYRFHPHHGHLDVSWAIAGESSPLHIAGSQTRTGKLWFPSASRKPRSYTSVLNTSSDIRVNLHNSAAFMISYKTIKESTYSKLPKSKLHQPLSKNTYRISSNKC